MSEVDELAKKCVGKKLPICLYQPCVQNCEFLKQYCETPGELTKWLKDGLYREKPEIAYSCNMCGLCSKLCVRSLDVGRTSLELRQRMVREGLGPLPRHEAVLATQEWVASDSFALTLPPPDGTECKRFLFPGCNLSAYSPDVVLSAYEYLREKLPGTGIILGCCGAPYHDIGEQAHFLEGMDKVISEMHRFGVSELILCCPECNHIFKQYASQLELRSIYDVIAEYGAPEDAKVSTGRCFSLHDSCKARYEVNMRESVRTIATQLGYGIEEPEFSGEIARCCGMGGMVPYADFRLANRVIMNRAKEMPHDIVSYCASCRNAFAMVGRSSVHLLDLVFNPDWEKVAKTPPKQGPVRQQAQSELRERLLQGEVKT